MFSNHFIMLIESVDQEFRKDTVVMTLLYSLVSGISVREQEEVRLRDQLVRWLLQACIWNLGRNL